MCCLETSWEPVVRDTNGLGQADSSELDRSGWIQDLGVPGLSNGLDMEMKEKAGTMCYNDLFLSLLPSLDTGLNYIVVTVMVPE